MPRWGRPPGARVGRQTRRADPWVDGAVRIEEIDSGGEDAYIRRDVSSLYARQSAGLDEDGGSRLRRRRMGYDYADEVASVDGVDYDLYEDMDSTVAYAVQLAMKDKEERLVDQALERIRHAQKQGQKNVRLSGRELEALERKRVQANRTPDSEYRASIPRGSPGSNRPLRPPESPSSKIGAQRSGSSASLPNKHGMPSSLSANNAAYAFWARTLGASAGAQTSARSPSARGASKQTPSRTPLQPAYSPDRLASVPLARTSGSVNPPAFTRSLPDDPHWVPPYPVSYPREPPPPLYPTDPRHSGPMPYTSGYSSVFDESLRSSGRGPAASLGELGFAAGGTRGGEGEEVSSSDDSAKVVERRVPIGRGSRQRSNRP
ncbi:prenylated rab acceptor 1 [Aspergillus sclerotioniger CBS 115572]|uniref:Prenylated rab acceptor 1 n=1 Tax=Aspergillus sclerotioniger CBS 115572 TaxID=1450535 RepID=A0A317VPT4_9EURO|nr:prenylated rab acceptor 1 [Aspergillus sclerotioniger CBS 115572]PWY76373.1 prenylated rab acceptor 1 [Aspergillus sclerotioniger CBS 115572]